MGAGKFIMGTLELMSPDDLKQSLITLSDEGRVQIPTPIDTPELKATILSNEDGIMSPFTGFKNLLIDGRFDFWYEGTSQSNAGYGSDTMWYNFHVGSTKVHSKQNFTLGSVFPDGTLTPASFSRTVVSSVNGASNKVVKWQYIEDVTRLAGKTVTLSFLAKADSNKKIAIDLGQTFGTGGTPSADVYMDANTFDLTTVWTKYTMTVTLPSILGKTIGSNGVQTSGTWVQFWFDAGTSFNVRTNNLGQQSGTFDIAMVQLEEGSVATTFSNTSYGVEELRVMRYFEQNSESKVFSLRTSNYMGDLLVPFKVRKRLLPTVALLSAQANVTITPDGLDSLTFWYNVAIGTSNVYCTAGFKADARL